jgi:anaerobic ribonucleoside-triphosphate reductase activating protein
VDVLVAGRYDARRPAARAWLGSANQTLHCLTARYTPADLDAVPAAEVVLTPDGHVQVSGLGPPA